jgi:hypothetical protein
METYITDKIRVVIVTGGMFPYLIQTEQKADVYSLPWEVQGNGWRACVTETALTMEEAKAKYQRQIADERRWH